MPDAVNPKERQAATDGKAPLDYLDPAADEQIAWVLKHGADKYGRRNFRAPGQEMKVTVYLGAIQRHVNAIKRGEWLDPDDGRTHLAHVGACVHVMLAAEDAGTLVDDTQRCVVTALSDRVHVDGDTDAKALGASFRDSLQALGASFRDSIPADPSAEQVRPRGATTRADS